MGYYPSLYYQALSLTLPHICNDNTYTLPLSLATIGCVRKAITSLKTCPTLVVPLLALVPSLHHLVASP